MASNSSSHDKHAEEIVWDEEFQCIRINNILSPMPISMYHPPPPSAGNSRKQQRHEPQEPANQPSGCKRQNVTELRIFEIKKVNFQLFRCDETGIYILAMNEVDSVKKTFYVLLSYEKQGQMKMEANETTIGKREISPVVGEIFPNLNSRSNLSMEERLQGKWTIKLHEQFELLKSEKVYCHEKVDQIFKTMNDVATFIAYNITN